MNIVVELEKLRRTHYVCEDCFYSCPKSGDKCSDGTECDCGADEHNKILDAIIDDIKNPKR